MKREMREQICKRIRVWIGIIAAAVCVAGFALPAFAAGETEEILFDEEDLKAYKALPAKMTTEYKDQVNALLTKLEAAENKDEYASVLTGLRQKKKSIDQIQKEINEINTQISAHYSTEEDWQKMSAQDALQLEERIKRLSEYDQAQIQDYDRLQEAVDGFVSPKRTRVITFLIVAAVVLIALSVTLSVLHRRKLKRIQDTEDSFRKKEQN